MCRALCPPRKESLSVHPPKIGRRLREFRQARGKSQTEVAEKLGVSRSTIAQMELDNRKVYAEDLTRLARIYGCSPASLLVVPDQFDQHDDLLHQLSLAIPEFTEDPATFKGLREAVTLSRELTTLEKTLGLERYAAGPPVHCFGLPATQWECAHQGYVAAQEERWRMNLGDAPIRDVDDTLAMMRVRATQASLPDSVLSLFLQAPDTGTLVVVNESLSLVERRFQYAHGYAHALFDNEHRWLVCRTDCRDSLPELRATAFAGRFLLPETGVRRYLQSLGKDTLGRAVGTVQKLFSERVGQGTSESPVRVEGRGRKGTTSMSALDLTQIACYFGVSAALASHNLRNLRYVTDDELSRLELQDAEGTVARTIEVLDLRTMRKAPKRDAFRSRLLAQAVEAVRRGLIDDAQFRRTADLVGVTTEEQQLLLDASNPETNKKEDAQ